MKTEELASLSVGSRQILEVVRRAPANGYLTDDFARAIGSPSAKSVPVRMMVLGKELRAMGLKKEDVIKRSRIYVKGRGKSVFKPGPRIEDALRQNGELFAQR